jgi:hypothetical protein
MRIVVFLSSLALLGTVLLAQSVTYDFDKTANFSRFKTYAWTKGTPVPDELNHKRIVQAIDAQVSTKGMARVDTTAGPDVLVAYHASFDRNLQVNAIGVGWGPPAARSGSARVEEITVGTLAIDVVDAANRTIVWRGLASHDLDLKASPAKRDRNIDRTAEKLFKNYPPKP